MNPAIHLRLTPDGRMECLHTEAIDLRKLGRLHVVRATEVAFEESSQHWRVLCARTGAVLHRDPSREACLAWERAGIRPWSTPSQPIQSPRPPIPGLLRSPDTPPTPIPPTPS